MTPADDYEALRAKAVAHLKEIQNPVITDKLRNLFGPIVYAQYEAQLHEYLFDAAVALISRGYENAADWDVARDRLDTLTALVGRHLFQHN